LIKLPKGSIEDEIGSDDDLPNPIHPFLYMLACTAHEPMDCPDRRSCTSTHKQKQEKICICNAVTVHRITGQVKQSALRTNCQIFFGQNLDIVSLGMGK